MSKNKFNLDLHEFIRFHGYLHRSINYAPQGKLLADICGINCFLKRKLCFKQNIDLVLSSLKSSLYHKITFELVENQML